jgi:hypothetical protein
LTLAVSHLLDISNLSEFALNASKVPSGPGLKYMNIEPVADAVGYASASGSNFGPPEVFRGGWRFWGEQERYV